MFLRQLGNGLAVEKAVHQGDISINVWTEPPAGAQPVHYPHRTTSLDDALCTRFRIHDNLDRSFADSKIAGGTP
ncbi:hypothetical protein [Mesorhizobium sp.]|uniref:hypothetical protein n=1 Tax=Mesorhizobium sp. TaxID=1871066 RepID=UPI0025FE9944|nr:hypothetical protein [Mesorhizobium sp.]